MAPYKLRFLDSARKEWNKLGSTVREQFVKKLAERLEHPRVPSAALYTMLDCYKIKGLSVNKWSVRQGRGKALFLRKECTLTVLDWSKKAL